jgi:Thiamine pyrophosphate-requiring enzymes [acetolactate synthase, pyruvate dehydrogenase (cytochrome), glyoxylate carboligase, phosphonopyruvate decarboxylase]
MALRTGGQILVASLLAQRATHAFGVPGESYLAVLDALYDVTGRLRYIVCRQEGGAAYMAEAFGKLTGRPGIVFVTRGPGASNAAVGIHTAAQDSTPMIAFIGQVGSDTTDREAFQEIDYRRMYGSVAKWAAQIDRADRIPEYVAHAYRIALSGRPGPVVIALPEDMLSARADVADAPYVDAIAASPSPEDVRTVERQLRSARRPLVIVGGSRWTDQARVSLRQFAEASGLPVACAFRHQDIFDNRHPNFAGDVGLGINPRLSARVRDADVLLVIGERLGERTTSAYTLLDVPVPRQTLVHVHPGADELGRVYQPALAIAATPGAFLAAIDGVAARPEAISDAAAGAHGEYEAWRDPRPVPGSVDLWRVVRWLDERLPEDAILTNGAGNYATWVHRLYRYGAARRQLAPYSGSMGYGVPSAVAAKVIYPERVVVSWNGDGCFLMNGQELATAVQYDLRIVFVVIDNGMYGTIRMHQEIEYPARVSGTELVNPDFAALARAYGAHGETVRSTEAFAPAFERAIRFEGPSLLHVVVDPQALTMSASLDDLREQGLNRQRRVSA